MARTPDLRGGLTKTESLRKQAQAGGPMAEIARAVAGQGERAGYRRVLAEQYLRQSAEQGAKAGQGGAKLPFDSLAAEVLKQGSAGEAAVKVALDLNSVANDLRRLQGGKASPPDSSVLLKMAQGAPFGMGLGLSNLQMRIPGAPEQLGVTSPALQDLWNQYRNRSWESARQPQSQEESPQDRSWGSDRQPQSQEEPPSTPGPVPTPTSAEEAAQVSFPGGRPPVSTAAEEAAQMSFPMGQPPDSAGAAAPDGTSYSEPPPLYDFEGDTGPGTPAPPPPVGGDIQLAPAPAAYPQSLPEEHPPTVPAQAAPAPAPRGHVPERVGGGRPQAAPPAAVAAGQQAVQQGVRNITPGPGMTQVPVKVRNITPGPGMTKIPVQQHIIRRAIAQGQAAPQVPRIQPGPAVPAAESPAPDWAVNRARTWIAQHPGRAPAQQELMSTQGPMFPESGGAVYQ